MSLTDTRPANAASVPGSGSAPGPMPVRAVLPRRRRPGLAAAGLVIVILGFLGAYVYATSAGDSRPSLAMARTVTVGSPITDADLKEVKVNVASGLDPIPAGQRATVVGRIARVELVAGALLVADQLTDKAVPAAGQQLIGLELKPAQLPARPLRPGEPVLLVITSDPSNVANTEAKGTQTLPRPPTIKATVAGVGATTTDGTVVVDVLVNENDGPAVLDRASQGRVALALVARR